MDKFIKKQLKAWTFSTIQKDPQTFGGDNSNREIMNAYAKEFHKSSRVAELTPQTFSILSTVSRFKNIILKEHPEFDCRVRFAPKKRRAKVRKISYPISNYHSTTKKQLFGA